MSCTLIATDEAGYGPRLGPLVIAATAWDIADRHRLDAAFLSLELGVIVPGMGTMRVSDSKQIYSPGKHRALANLEIAMLGVWACTSQNELSTLRQWLMSLAPSDCEEISGLPWFENLDVPMPIDWDAALVSSLAAAALASPLQTEAARLTNAAATIVSARRFNCQCERSGNKATLLSELTIQLAMPLIDAAGPGHVEVFSDKHGGRCYYGAMLQHYFPDMMLSIEIEGQQTSCYQLSGAQQTVRWHFTAKGDRFTPVALASMIAKYTRERLMGQFNAFWQHRQPGLTPTAGYPGDAKRFLASIESLRQREGIDIADLVRCR